MFIHIPALRGRDKNALLADFSLFLRMHSRDLISCKQRLSRKELPTSQPHLPQNTIELSLSHLVEIS